MHQVRTLVLRQHDHGGGRRPQQIKRLLLLTVFLSFSANADTPSPSDLSSAELACHQRLAPSCLLVLAAEESRKLGPLPNLRMPTNPHLALLELQVVFGDIQGAEDTLTRLVSNVNRMIALIILNRLDEAEDLIPTLENEGIWYVKGLFNRYLRLAQAGAFASLEHIERDFKNDNGHFIFRASYKIIRHFTFKHALEIGFFYFNSLISLANDGNYLITFRPSEEHVEEKSPELEAPPIYVPYEFGHQSELLIEIGREEASAGDLEAAQLKFAEARVEAMSLEPILRAKPLISLGLAYFEAGFVEEARALALTSADIIRPKFFPTTELRGSFAMHPEIVTDARIGLLLAHVGEIERAEEAFDLIEVIIEAIPSFHWRPRDRSLARVRLCISRILATRSSCMENVLQFLETDGRRLWNEDSRVVLEKAVRSMLAHGLYEEVLLVADLSNEVEPRFRHNLLSTIVDYHLSKGDIATALRITSGQGKIELRDEFSAKLARAMIRANYNNEARSMLVSLSARRSSATPNGEVETEGNILFGDLLPRIRVARIQRTLGFVQDADNTLSAVFRDRENLHDRERRLYVLTSIIDAFIPMRARDFR